MKTGKTERIKKYGTLVRLILASTCCLLMASCATQNQRGTGDLGLVIERASGRVAVVETTHRSQLGAVDGLGDLSHASVVFSRDGRFAYVFGRDGGLSRVDILQQRVDRRIVQAGNSIGGAISQDGRLVVAQNYEPGGIKVFDAETLDLLADVPAEYGKEGKRSKVVGLADLPGNRFVFALFDAGEIWVTDLSEPRQPKITKFHQIGKQPYDALVTPNGRHYLAGLFGEDGIALVDLWRPEAGARKILTNYGRGEEKLPVFKMPHLRGWAVAGNHAYLPAIGRNEVLIVDMESWKEIGRIPVQGQPVFVMARPDGRQVWVNLPFRTMVRCKSSIHWNSASCRHWSLEKLYCTWNSRRVAKRSGFPLGTTIALQSTTQPVLRAWEN